MEIVWKQRRSSSYNFTQIYFCLMKYNIICILFSQKSSAAVFFLKSHRDYTCFCLSSHPSMCTHPKSGGWKLRIEINHVLGNFASIAKFGAILSLNSLNWSLFKAHRLNVNIPIVQVGMLHAYEKRRFVNLNLTIFSYEATANESSFLSAM